MTFSRRDFVKTSVLGAVAAGTGVHAAIPEVLAENGQPPHQSLPSARSSSVRTTATPMWKRHMPFSKVAETR